MTTKMKLLLHSCCGPCSVAVFEYLRGLDTEFSSFFYNPNIHPYQEYRARRDTWRELCAAEDVPMICRDEYLLEDWLAAVAADPAARCSFCYRSRLSAAAEAARENGFPAFSTTLLISPYQDREKIIAIGREEGAERGIEFIDFDFRPLFHKGQQMARVRGLYIQKYCGCIYSEKERFCKQPRKA